MATQAEQNLTKMERKEVLAVLYIAFFSRIDWLTKMGTLTSDWLIYFAFSVATTKQNLRKRYRKSSTQCALCWPSLAYHLIDWCIFEFFSTFPPGNVMTQRYFKSCSNFGQRYTGTQLCKSFVSVCICHKCTPLQMMLPQTFSLYSAIDGQRCLEKFVYKFNKYNSRIKCTFCSLRLLIFYMWVFSLNLLVLIFKLVRGFTYHLLFLNSICCLKIFYIEHCNGCGYPTEDANSSGHLVLSRLGLRLF